MLSIKERQEIGTKLLSLLKWEPREMLVDTMTVPHPNFCTSETFWPVLPSGLQLKWPRISTFITTKSFLLWEVKYFV